MKKQEVVALLEELPDDFNADELLLVLALRGEIERAAVECAAESDATPAGAPNGESPAARRLRVWSRLYNDREMMARLRNAFRMGKRRDHWIPFRQVQEEARRRRGEH
jgi:hypothetical protein